MLSISDTQHNENQHNDTQYNETMLYHYAERHYAECHNAESHFSECLLNMFPLVQYCRGKGMTIYYLMRLALECNLI